MPYYRVTIPIAGHVVVEVEASSEAEAQEQAFAVATLEDVEDWELLEQFNRGNVCYCPQPWRVKIECEEEEEG